MDTFPRLLLYHAETRGERPSIREKDYGIWQTWTWAQVAEEVRALARDSALSHSQVRRFLILHKELDPDDDELTRTRKLRRGFISEKYAVLIDALYSGKPSQLIETEVKFENGKRGMLRAELRICDTRTFTQQGGERKL